MRCFYYSSLLLREAAVIFLDQLSRHHNLVSAAHAFQAEVCTHAEDFPLLASARVLFFQFDDVSYFIFHWHRAPFCYILLHWTNISWSSPCLSKTFHTYMSDIFILHRQHLYLPDSLFSFSVKYPLFYSSTALISSAPSTFPMLSAISRSACSSRGVGDLLITTRYLPRK